MYRWALAVIALLASCQYGASIAPCDTMNDYFMEFSNCSMSLWGSGNNDSSVNGMKTYLRDICLSRVGSYVSCMTTKYNTCPTDVRNTVVNNVDDYKSRVCDGNQLKPFLTGLLTPMAELIGIAPNSTSYQQPCFMSQDPQLQTAMAFCYTNMAVSGQNSYLIMNMTIARGLPHVSKYYRRTLTCFRRVLRAHSTCSAEHIQGMLAYYMMLLPMARIQQQDMQLKSNAKPREGKRVTLGAFGDPHLVVHKAASLTTCSAPGRQVYLENDFILISANNTEVSPGSKATTITNLEIQVMDNNGKVKATFSAGNSKLPDSFDGGKDKIDIEGAAAEVKTLNRLVRIKVPSAGVVIMMSRYRHMYPLLLVRGSESVFEASSGLLVDGCLDEIPRTVARRKRATSECEEACKSQQDSAKKDACLFDCTETNDPAFAKQTTEDFASGEKEAEQVDYEMADDIKKKNSAMTVTWSLTCAVMLLTSLYSAY